MNGKKRKITVRTPMIPLEVDLFPQGVTRVCFIESEPSDTSDLGTAQEGTDMGNLVQQVQTWFQSYVRNGAVSFTPLLFPRGTEFQRLVWTELRSIPPGETRTYGEVATSIGKKSAAQAVGQACGQNPLPILIPCHRVVPSGSGHGGYAGPKKVKTKLLTHENAIQSGKFE